VLPASETGGGRESSLRCMLLNLPKNQGDSTHHGQHSSTPTNSETGDSTTRGGKSLIGNCQFCNMTG